jgi:hypothetical protein
MTLGTIVDKPRPRTLRWGFPGDISSPAPTWSEVSNYPEVAEPEQSSWAAALCALTNRVTRYGFNRGAAVVPLK